MIAYGAKPSVGGQSQRIIFEEHPDVDCIVHFHCPLRTIPKSRARYAPGADPEDFEIPVPVREQRPFECGSHECGKNTSDGLKQFVETPRPEFTDFLSSRMSETDCIKAVMLDEHGPNIGFKATTDPKLVISFIEEFWDLEAKTGGPVSLEAVQ